MIERQLARAHIPHLRLARQFIGRPAKGSVAAMVKRLVAVQAQDFAGAKWALGLRLQGVDDLQVERAFDAGEILRTHLLRPTWHFVSPADIRWLLMLTGPRVQARNASMCRKLGLDTRALDRSVAAIARALEKDRHLTRDALREVLKRARISTEGPQRMSYVMMHAELEGVICSGPRDGKQFTYALLERRAAPVKPISRDEALARSTSRGSSCSMDASSGPGAVCCAAMGSWWTRLCSCRCPPATARRSTRRSSGMASTSGCQPVSRSPDELGTRDLPGAPRLA